MSWPYDTKPKPGLFRSWPELCLSVGLALVAVLAAGYLIYELVTL